MKEMASAYYPPRARWYAPLLIHAGTLRRLLALDKLRLAPDLPFWGFLCSLTVPGLAFYVRGMRIWGACIVATWLLAFIVFMILLGYGIGNAAFSVLLSIHVTSIAFLFRSLLAQAGLKFRLLFPLAVLILLAFLIYIPARDFLQERFFMPLRLDGKVIVVGKLASAAGVHRGDWIAYTFEEQALAPQVILRAGYGLGPVLGLPGDRVRFTSAGFEINGIAHPALAHMPLSGELVVPEKHWFVWPNLGMTGHGNVPEERVAATMQRMAIISTDQFTGRAFKRWFGRRQPLS